MKVDGTILLLVRQEGMATRTETPPDDLFNPTHVPPGIQDMGLTDTAEVHALRDQRAGKNHTNLLPIAIGLAARLTHELRDRLLVAAGRQERILPLGRTLVRWIGEQRGSRHGSIAMFLQRHRKEFGPHLDVVGVDEHDALARLNRLDHARELRGVLRQRLGPEKRLSAVRILLALEREDSIELRIPRKHGHRGLHEKTTLLLFVFALEFLEDVRLDPRGGGLRQRQELKGRIPMVVPGLRGRRKIRDGRRKAKGKRKGVLALDVRDVFLTQTLKVRTLVLLERGVRIKEHRSRQRSRGILLALIPEEEVEVEEDLLIGLVHRRRRQKHENEPLGGLHETLQTRCDRLGFSDVHLRANVVRLVNDQKSVVKGLMDPRLKLRIALGLHLVDPIAERRIGRELVDLRDQLVRGLLQAIPHLGIRPVLWLLFNPLEHVQVAPSRTLLGLQKARLGQLHTRHIKQLIAKGLLDSRRCDDEDLLVLELGAKNVFLGNLDRGTGLSRARAVDDQDTARGCIGRENTTQEPLVRLKGKSTLGCGTGFAPKIPERVFRRRREGRGRQFRQFGIREVRHYFVR